MYHIFRYLLNMYSPNRILYNSMHKQGNPLLQQKWQLMYNIDAPMPKGGPRGRDGVRPRYFTGVRGRVLIL